MARPPWLASAQAVRRGLRNRSGRRVKTVVSTRRGGAKNDDATALILPVGQAAARGAALLRPRLASAGGVPPQAVVSLYAASRRSP